MSKDLKVLYQKPNINIYDRVSSSEPIEFLNEDLETVMRYSFGGKKESYYNIDNNSEKIKKVFHFRNITNLYVDTEGENYKNNVNRGFMKATFSYIILELLRDNRLSNINFEINIVNRAKVKKESKLIRYPYIYDELLTSKYRKNDEILFSSFLVENRVEDIRYYDSILDKTKVIVEKDELKNQFQFEDYSPSELKSIFEDRLIREKEKSVIRPFCKPFKYNDIQENIILNKEVILDYDFRFYRYSESEIVEYSLLKRNDSENHINSMCDLYLDEYPAPNLQGRVFMVSRNGNNRRLVFVCLGLEKIRANIRYVNDNTSESWIYYFHISNIPMEKVINWLLSKKNIEFKCLDKKAILIKDSTNLIPWILPNSQICSYKKIYSDILRRLKFVERAFGQQNFVRGFIRKSYFLWYIDVQRVYILSILKSLLIK